MSVRLAWASTVSSKAKTLNMREKFLAVLIAALTVGALAFALRDQLPDPDKKFWAHRCDSLEKFQLMSRKYQGLEIDATFYAEEPRGQKFDVSHDEQPQIDYPLENFMPTIAACDNVIWFDFKNLTADNAAAALEELDGLLAAHGIERGRFIIESHDYEDLKAFRERGYYTSYCVPIHESAYGDEIKRDKNFVFQSPGRVEYFCRLVREAIDSGNVDAISFPLTYYRLVKYADVDAELLTWDTHDEKWWNFYAREELRDILFDDKVTGILVSTPTDFDR